ncbi:MAG: hypothetical protein AAF412_01110 [Pseudomonadota bacterium]
MAKPEAGSGRNSIDTGYLPVVEDDSVVIDEEGTPIGVAGKHALPGPLAGRDIKPVKTLEG